MDKKGQLNGRSLTSFSVLLSFVVIAVSGVMLFVSPKGRVAHWTGWTMWGLGKEEWEAVHLTMAIAFVLGVAFHIYFNWAFMVRYVKNAAAKGVRSKRELGLAAAAIVAVFLGTRMEIPPFSSIVALGENIKDYWETNSPRVPYPHAEESTVAEFATNVGLPLERVTERLHEKGFAFGDPGITVGDLAAKHGKTPEQLFSGMASNASGGAFGTGRGFGRMTFEELCTEVGVHAETGKAILLEHGIEVLEGEQTRDIAVKSGMTPGGLMRLLTEGATPGEVLFETPSDAIEGAGNLFPETAGPANGDRFQGEAPGYGRGQGPGYGQGQGRGNGQGQGLGYGRGQGRGYGQGQGRGYGRGQGRGYGRGQGRGYGQGQGRGAAAMARGRGVAMAGARGVAMARGRGAVMARGRGRGAVMAWGRSRLRKRRWTRERSGHKLAPINPARPLVGEALMCWPLGRWYGLWRHANVSDVVSYAILSPCVRGTTQARNQTYAYWNPARKRPRRQ